MSGDTTSADGNGDGPDDDVVNENGEIWAAGELGEELDEYYGVEGLRVQAGFYDEDQDEQLYDCLTYFDGKEEHPIAADVKLLGHAESGAEGVAVESLPSKETVMSVVDAAEEGS